MNATEQLRELGKELNELVAETDSVMFDRMSKSWNLKAHRLLGDLDDADLGLTSQLHDLIVRWAGLHVEPEEVEVEGASGRPEHVRMVEHRFEFVDNSN